MPEKSPKLDITKTKQLDGGVLQHDFQVEVEGGAEIIPCVLWTPAESKPAVLIGMGHGGSQHKKTADIRERAARYAAEHGWASFAVDAPGHGDRITREEAAKLTQEAQEVFEAGGYENPLSSEDKAKYVDDLADEAVPGWIAALDALIASGVAGPAPAIGYWGVSIGSWIGIPLLATDARYQCAVVGLSQLDPVHTRFRDAAARITIPLRYVMQWDDEVRVRQYGLDLFDTFASEDKSMHINPGRHNEIPAREADSWAAFFARCLEG